MGPEVTHDNRLPLAASAGLFAGFIAMVGKIIGGQDPIKAVQQSLAKGIAALGDSELREAAEKMKKM